MSRPLSQPDTFTAVADPTRRALLEILSRGERSVSELLEPFEMTMPALSRHLRVLREAGLVQQERRGRRRIYRLDATPLHEVAAWVSSFEAFWDEKLDGLAGYLDEAPRGETP